MTDFPLHLAAGTHDIALLTTIAAGLTCAWLLGLLAQRIGLSPIVGYLLAGVVVGPHTPGFTADTKLATQLAEIGVILLMFGVGLHFHLKDMMAVRRIAVPGAIGQSAAATVLGLGVAMAFGWGTQPGLVLGMAMAVASTVVLMRVLMDNNMLDTSAGHAAVGWLIVEDILTVVILVMLPALAGEGGLLVSVGLAIGKIAILAGVVLFGGGKVIPWLMIRVARLRSRELFTLTVLVIAIAVAVGAYVSFGVSMALAAFLAGMVVGQTPASQQAGADALPMRDAFSVLFFVSVGMLFDPAFLLREPWMILACLGIVMIGKPLAAFLIVVLLGYSVKTALIVSVALAQIGEFSFILADAAAKLNLLPVEGTSALVACAIVSITLNGPLFKLIPRMEAFFARHPALKGFVDGRAARGQADANAAAAEAIRARPPKAVVVGFGPVGRTLDRLLRAGGMETVVLDMNMDTVLQLRNEGRLAIFGDATNPEILRDAGVAEASHLVVTLPHGQNRHALVTAARQLNPGLRIIIRARYLLERNELESLGVHAACYEEAEAALGLARILLADIGSDAETIARETKLIRLEIAAP